MLIPYSTDAPLYHYPIATVSFIVINVLFFVAFCLGPAPQSVSLVDDTGRVVSQEEVMRKVNELKQTGQDPQAYLDSLTASSDTSNNIRERLILQFGHGLLPWQWITSMFMHADIMHLIGNMIFLWSFGLVIEGRVGNLPFAGLYLAMGAVQAAIVQALMWTSDSGALGASGAIFSLLALVVIFAPVNSFEVLLLMFRITTFEMPILMFGFIYVAMNTLFFFIGGAAMSSEALHLIGFLVGLPVGFFLLTRGYVDCEGYDLISHLQDKKGRESTVGKMHSQGRAKSRRSKVEVDDQQPTPAKTSAMIQSQVDRAIQEGNFDVAVALQRKRAKEVPGAAWSQPQLAEVIRGYVKAQDYAKAEALMAVHIDLFEAHRFSMQVNLLKLWLHDQRPRHALRYIKGLKPAFLSSDNQLQLQKLIGVAKEQIRSGVLEVE